MTPPGYGPTDPADVLPSSLGEAFRVEWARVFRPTFDTLTTLAVNGALMTSAWFFLPPGLKDSVFDLHGSAVFAVFLALWMYSDVPATNMIAPDAHRMIAAIDSPAILRRMLWARAAVIWALVTPLCLVLTVIYGLTDGHWLATFYGGVWIVFVPVTTLAVTPWVGIIWPFHKLAFRQRLAQRKPFWPNLGRFGLLTLVPYGLVPLLGVMLTVPAFLAWNISVSDVTHQHIPDSRLGLGVLISVAVSLVVTRLGQNVSLALIRRRRSKLLAFLAESPIP